MTHPTHTHWKKQNFPREQLPVGCLLENGDSYHSSKKRHEKKEQLQVFQGSSQHWCSPSLQEDLKEKKSQKTAYSSAILHFLLQDRGRKKDFSLPLTHKYRTFIPYFFLSFFLQHKLKSLLPVLLGTKENGN